MCAKKKVKKEKVTTKVVHGKFKEVDGYVDGEPEGGVMRLTPNKNSRMAGREVYLSGKRGGSLKLHGNLDSAAARFPRITPKIKKLL